MYVLISVPSPPSHPWIHKHVVHVMMNLLINKRYKVNIITPSWNPFEHSLHRIVKDFVEGDYTHWLNIDADNPPIANPLDLVELDRDIIGLPTPVIHIDENHPEDRPFTWNAWDYVPEKDAYKEHECKDGLQKVDAVGTGCVLFSKRVFLHPELQKGAFHRTYDEWGIVDKGNDIAFCERARMCGFEIYTHFGYPCRHFNELEIIEVGEAFMRCKNE